MRNPNTKADEKIKEIHSMQDGDTFLKWGEGDERSTQLSIKEEYLSLNSRGGKSGIIIRSNGKIIIQGDIDLSASMGTSIKKAWFTENFLSFIPSTLWTEIPGYLFRIPDISGLKGILSLLTKFESLF